MDYNALLKEIFEEAKRIDIPVSDHILPEVAINTRAKRRYGRCVYKDGKYTIELSAYLQGKDERLIRTVLAHELLHTCKDCMNHGTLWKQYAAKMNRAYGYDITRTAGEPLVEEEPKYAVQCTSCGKLCTRMKKCRLIQHPSYYRCTCGGRLVRVR